MLVLGIDRVDGFVEKQQELGNDVYWEGWTLVFHRPHPRALYTTDGAFHNGVMGYANRVPVSDDGTWKIDYRNVRKNKRS